MEHQLLRRSGRSFFQDEIFEPRPEGSDGAGQGKGRVRAEGTAQVNSLRQDSGWQFGERRLGGWS